MPTIKASDLRPGMHVNPHQYSAYPITLDIEGMAIRSVTFRRDGTVDYVDSYHSGDGKQPDDPIQITTPPPRVLMSWHKESGCWAILIDTTNGSGQSYLNIALNDAELFDGVTDPEPAR